MDGKSFPECSVSTGVPQRSILGSSLFCLCINDLDDVICGIFIYVDDSALYFKFDQASELWHYS